jgi:hypothetical protein
MSEKYQGRAARRLSFVQPIKFEFVVNLNAAWVGWPAKPLVLADDVVE